MQEAAGEAPLPAGSGRPTAEATPRSSAHGWSLERLAEEAELHWTYVGSVERDERNVGLRNTLKLASALDVDAGTLVTRLGL